MKSKQTIAFGLSLSLILLYALFFARSRNSRKVVFPHVGTWQSKFGRSVIRFTADGKCFLSGKKEKQSQQGVYNYAMKGNQAIIEAPQINDELIITPVNDGAELRVNSSKIHAMRLYKVE